MDQDLRPEPVNEVTEEAQWRAEFHEREQARLRVAFWPVVGAVLTANLITAFAVWALRQLL